MAGAYIFGIIINKLSYKQKSSLIILLKIEKSLKTSLYIAVLLLGLAFCLEVKSG